MHGPVVQPFLAKRPFFYIMSVMRHRSSAEMSTLVVDTSRQTSPAPPLELTDAQAQVWRDVVGSLPGNWLTRAAHPILIAYCRHACRSRLLEIQIAQSDWNAALQQEATDLIDHSRSLGRGGSLLHRMSLRLALN
jgi:hypothetical protein